MHDQLNESSQSIGQSDALESSSQPKSTLVIEYDGTTTWRKYNRINPQTGKKAYSSFWSTTPLNNYYFVQMAHFKEDEHHQDQVDFRLDSEGNIHLGQKIGKRWFEVKYDSLGNYRSFTYNVFLGSGRPDQVVARFISFNDQYQLAEEKKNKYYGSLDSQEFEWDLDQSSTSKTLRRSVNGEAVDEFVVPINIDVADMLFKFAPDPLIRDPKTDKEQFDANWKNLDPLHEAGMKWTAIGNDQYGSLDRMSMDLNDSDIIISE